MADFPKAAGTSEASARGGGRLMPHLPGTAMLGKSKNKKVVASAAALLQQYLTQICSLSPPSFAPDVAVATAYAFALFCFTTDEDLETAERAGIGTNVLTTAPLIQPDNTAAVDTDASSIQANETRHDALTEPDADEGDEGMEVEQFRAIAAFKGEASGELSFDAGDILIVLEKNTSGWWFCSRDADDSAGWAPATYLDKVGNSDKSAVTPVPELGQSAVEYVAIQSYTPSQEDEIGVTVGDTVIVKSRRMDGWWMIEHQGNSGWAPASFFQEVQIRRRAGGTPRPKSTLGQNRRSGFKTKIATKTAAKTAIVPIATAKTAPPRRSTISMQKPENTAPATQQ